MWGFETTTYGDGWADVYDDWYPDLTGTDAAVEALDHLAGPPGESVVLELGIGTGRLALPLAARGHDVRGIDASAAMVDRLRAKPGGDAIAVTLGDMADVVVPPQPGSGPATEAAEADGAGRSCSLVFAAYNTFLNLATADDQQRCLQRAARALAPGGRVVIEAYVPDRASAPGPTLAVRDLLANRLVLSADVVDPATQTVRGQVVDISEAGIRLRPYLVRYLWPHQLDDLAAAAGLVLEARWADWAGTPFDDEDEGHDVHVSIYRRAEGS